MHLEDILRICEKYVKIVVEMNENNTTIKLELTAAVLPTMGIRQEDCLNPILFNLVIDLVIDNKE
jgi:hypothetical protein